MEPATPALHLGRVTLSLRQLGVEPHTKEVGHGEVYYLGGAPWCRRSVARGWTPTAAWRSPVGRGGYRVELREAAIRFLVPPGELESLLRRSVPSARSRAVSTGGYVLSEGQADAPVYLVLEGAFKITRSAEVGKSAIVAVRFPGWLLGAATAIVGGPSPVAAISLASSRVLMADRRVFLKGLSDSAELTNAALKMHALELCRVISDSAAGPALPARKRLMRFLRQMALEQPVRQQTEFLPVDVRLTHDDLADAVGSTREHITRLLHQLAAEGEIRRQGHTMLVRRA